MADGVIIEERISVAESINSPKDVDEKKHQGVKRYTLSWIHAKFLIIYTALSVV